MHSCATLGTQVCEGAPSTTYRDPYKCSRWRQNCVCGVLRHMGESHYSFYSFSKQNDRPPRRHQNSSPDHAARVLQPFGLAFRLPEERSALKALRTSKDLHLQLRRRCIRRCNLLRPSWTMMQHFEALVKGAATCSDLRKLWCTFLKAS